MIETLKIYPKLGEICNSVKNNAVTIVSTPTGSGKTLATPISLASCLGKRVFVTVPRVDLAKQARLSVIKLIVGQNNSHMVGVMTGRYNEYTDAQLVFCTERSFLNRVQLKADDILVVDEIHEQGINTEEVIYFAKQHTLKGGKVVLMSATMDVTKYINYFGSATVVELPNTERQYKTRIINCSEFNYLDKVIELGGITLIGTNGKKEIDYLTSTLVLKKYDSPIFQYHSEMEDDDHANMMYHWSNNIPCITIATSVAMSGITPENLNTVVVPIWGNRIEDGKLVKYLLSEAEAKQWEGRVGRVCDGTAIRIDLNYTREANPLPEILRIDTTDVILSFLGQGIDLRKIELLNQPELEKVEKSFKVLELSGIVSEGTLTEKGQFIAKLGEGLVTGSLLFEGKQLGIENFAMKLAAVISNGNPFRKMRYKYKGLNRDFSMSEHYLVVDTIENDEMLDFKFNPDLKTFAQNNGIFLKGVNGLKKQFNRINRDYKDQVEITYPLLCTLLSKQLVTNLYNYGSNDFGRVVANNYDDKMYCTLSPVVLKGGMLAELTTILV